MKIKITILISLFYLLLTNLFAQITITIQPGPTNGKDAVIDQINPTTNFGTSNEFISYDWTFSSIESVGKSLIQFDLSSVPPNSVISSAKLSLFYPPSSGSAGQAGDNACYLKRITSSWSENTVTWNTVPTITTTGEVYLPTSTSSTQDYPNIDITAFVTDWYANPSSNYGLMLDIINKSLYNSMKFCSSDYSDSLKRPKLIITYTQQVVADSCLTIQSGSIDGKDAVIDQLNPTTNYATANEFISYDWTFSSIESVGKSLIQFDLSAVPSNSIIADAKLSLFYPQSGSAGQAGDNACYLKKITSSWDENTVTWNTAPTITTTGEVYLPTSISSTQDYPNIDITAFVTDWYTNPSTNYGLMLDIINESLYNSMKFCSSDYSNPLKRPKLVICYKKGSSINDIENKSNSALLYPSLANDKITIEFLKLSETNSIEIFNLSGQELLKKQIRDYKTQIDVSYLPKGLYFVRLTNGNAVEVKKIIKE